MKGSLLAETLPEEGNQERKGSTLYPGGQWTPFSEQKCGLCLFWEFSGQNGKKTLEEILVWTKGTSESSCAPKGFFVPT